MLLSEIPSLKLDPMQGTISEEAPRRRDSMFGEDRPPIRRWDGFRKKITNWDRLRKDPELWAQDGDCFVYLYAKGQSTRGPAFKIPFELLLDKQHKTLADLCSVADISHEASSLDRNSFASDSTTSQFGIHKLYLPAPEHLTGKEVYCYHIVTRNVFAFLLGKPIVATNLGEGLVQLTKRLQDLSRRVDDEALDAVSKYIRAQKYAECANNPDFALSLLHFSEYFGLQREWLNAFVHCVGMNERLHLHSSYYFVPKATRALLSYARTNMDMKLEHSWALLERFEPITSLPISTSKQAEACRLLFRGFLKSYHEQKYGVWPPSVDESAKRKPYSRALYEDMLFEFYSLYDCLAERCSGFTEGAPAKSHIDQELLEFDKVNNFPHLRYSLPLIPKEISGLRRALARCSLTRLRGRLQNLKRSRSGFSYSHSANNTSDPTPTPVNDYWSGLQGSTDLVRAYLTFERKCIAKVGGADMSMNLSIQDLRSQSWISIYAILQILKSITSAPGGALDTMNLDYFVCCDLRDEFSLRMAC